MKIRALVVSVLVAATATAQEHPNVAKGFAPDKIFAVGDVDSVNAFNGNLLLTLPIGARYPLREGFSYGLSAVYNSNVWDFRDISAGSISTTQARISRRSNVGAGWRLSLGNLYSPDAKADIPFNDTGYWVYVGPDAAEHRLLPILHDGDPDDPGDVGKIQKTLYSRDGSYLRLKINADGTHALEFPDGQIHTFNANRQLVEIRDRFIQGGVSSNFLRIDYTPTTWTLTDSRGRVQTLTFSNLMQDTLPIQRLDKVELTAFPGSAQPPTATWTFQYAQVLIPRVCPDCAGGPSNDANTTNNLTVHFLTGITQPDGSVWSMPVSDYVTANPPGFNDLVGRIKGLTLPTLGRLEWDYGFYIFPSSSTERRPWAQSARGVVARRKKTASGAVEGTWTYSPHLQFEGTSTESQSQELTVTVTTPLGDKTENYFSVYAFGNNPPGVYPNILDYGRPFTPKVSDGQGRFLSSRVFDCLPNGTVCKPVRSTWIRYEQDFSPGVGNDGSGEGQLLDPRVAQTRTAFEDDCPSNVTDCGITTPIPLPSTRYYSDEDFSGFDGLGHYRTRNLRGNFPDTTSITETTSYNPARGIYGTPGFSMLPSSAPWLLGLYQDVTRSNNSGENSTVENCFDASTGFLKRKRVRKFGPTNDDILVVYTPNGTGTGDGNVGREDWAGGDGGNVPIADLCDLIPPGAAYSLKHTYSSAILVKSEYLKASGTVFEFAAVDRTVDSRTGLVSAEKDVSQLQTTYEYDTLDRLTWVQPAPGHGAWTEYVYARATSPASLAKVTINQHANGAKGNAIFTTSSLFFDSFGRLIKEQRKMPGGTFSNRETTYDAIGNRATVSEWEAGVPSNNTQYLDYDPFGRARTIRPSDGSGHDVTITRSGARVVTKKSKVWGPCGAGGALQECSSDTIELYDQVGRLFRIDQPVAWPTTAIPTPAPLRTSYAYDIGDRLKTVKQFDPVSLSVIQQRNFSYDNRGFLTSESHPELGPAGVTYSNYDARGHAHQKFDGVSDLTFEYDRAERMTRVRESGTFIGCGTIARPRCLKEYTFGTSNSGSDLRLGKVQVATRYNYPVLGTTTHTVAVAETYAYAGKEGRASKRDTQVFFNTAPTEAFTQGFAYDDLGNTASLTYPLCTQSGCAPPPPQTATPKVVNFTYAEGLLTSVRDASLFAYASSITYNSNQTISQVVHSNGITDVIGLDPTAQQRPASILARNAAGTNLWNAGTYLYDGFGNIKSIGGSGFAYDPASRLITANLWDGTGATGTPLKTQSYSYDLFGNLQAIGGLGGRNTPTSSTTNRLNGAGMAYDAAGNQTNNAGALHEYDPFHLMWHFQSAAEDWRYVYTAEDERIWSFKTGGISRWTLRDLGNNVLREYANNGGTWSVTEDFIHRGGQLLAADTSAGVSHFHLDHLGTPRLVTNQSGVKIAYHVYWPYGEELTSPTQDAERMKFTGHERDLNGAGGVGDDLDYMHARFCSPVTGRFLGVDRLPGTLGSPQSWNRYAYAIDNPLKLVDPDGNHPVLILAVVAVVALLSEPEAANAPGSRAEHAAGIPRKDEAGTLAAAAKAAAVLVGLSQVFAGDVSRNDDAETAREPATVQQNKQAGDEYRDQVAKEISDNGNSTKNEVTKKTPFGPRRVDIEVTKDGKVVGGVETKTGDSPYIPSQRAKDNYLKSIGYDVTLIRKPPEKK